MGWLHADHFVEKQVSVGGQMEIKDGEAEPLHDTGTTISANFRTGQTGQLLRAQLFGGQLRSS